MANPGITREDALRRILAVEDALREGYPPPGQQEAGKRGAITTAALRLGVRSTNPRGWVNAAVRIVGREPDWALYQRAEPENLDTGPPVLSLPELADRMIALLRRRPRSTDGLARVLAVDEAGVLDAVELLIGRGFNLHNLAGRWSIEQTIPPAYTSEELPEYVSRRDNTFVFGATSDNHLGSRFERLDVLRDLYDIFAEAGVDRVLNAGNWIDGEARFNKHDLHIHGMENQCRYLAHEYPHREGLTTYAVSGDDHEGWYAQREGVDIGKFAQNIMRECGREDWINLGYMEAHIRLVNANTGQWSVLSLVHPGGGSAYAMSYSIQKIIESLEGGEKPAVGLYGHYHKLWAGNIRNVWCLQTGTTQDQTPFMRKKKLAAHVGGAMVRMTQDPATGAITRFMPEMMRYFNAGYYNDRWAPAGAVNQPVLA